MDSNRTSLIVTVVVLLASHHSVNCSAPDQGIPDAQEDAVDLEGAHSEILGDEISDPGVKDTGPGLEVEFDAPVEQDTAQVEHLRVRMKVDDSANKTYSGGQMKWTGSFSWSSDDNTIVTASSWLPTDGPFPPLFDDGPAAEGGHEPNGATKGDHVFEVEVLFFSEEDKTFEYGVLNEFDRWIWIGPNGLFDVDAGSSGTLALPGLVIPGFGDIDFKVTLDTDKLHEDFSDIMDPGVSYNFYLKSSANSWTPVQMLDDGKKGDDAAGDGVFTYVQSLNLGPHDGLLYEGQHAQFVFVFAMAEINPDDGLEYKVGSEAARDGVAAFSDQGSPGNLHEEPIVMERDSRGKVFNTTIIVGDGKPWCNVEEDCYEDVECVDGLCGEAGQTEKDPVIESLSPAFGPATGGTEVTVTGHDFYADAVLSMGDVEVPADVVTGTSITFTTPKHAIGQVGMKVSNPGGKFDSMEEAFTFVPIHTPVMDGDVGSDWDDTLLIATNNIDTDWDGNELKGLYVAFDSTHLYIGIVGFCGVDNAIVAYLDNDLGAATGAADMTTLSDNEGELDTAISSNLVVGVDGFGADFAAGTKGMQTFIEGADLGESNGAGWRGLADTSDFAWLQGTVVTSGTGVEAAIPLTTIFDGRNPTTSATMALAIRLVNTDGLYTSNQTLPEGPQEASWSMDLVGGFPYRQ